MLHTAAVESATMAALNKVMKLPSLRDFVLVGGTALTLHKGHRLSIDIDLFSDKKPFNRDLVMNELSQAGKIVLKDAFDYAMFLEFDDVKLDVLKYQYDWIEKPLVESGIRIASIRDIMAMKLSAITKRGKKKDFYDIYSILQASSLEEMFVQFKKKYSTEEIYMTIKSLIYFEDADLDADPVMIGKQIKWQNVKEFIRKKVKEIA